MPQEPFSLTDLDRRILDVLQQDGRLSNQEVAERVASSASSVWRRWHAMEEAGIVAGLRPVLNPDKLGLVVTVLLHVSLYRHTDEIMREFNRLIADTPNVLECYAVTGDYDYVLKILAPDNHAYYQLLEAEFMSKAYVSRTSSAVVMKKLKETAVISSRMMP